MALPIGWPAESPVESLPAVYVGFPGASWPPAGPRTPVSVAAVASWRVERELVGSVLPGNVRARSGLSVGVAGVTLAQPGSDTDLLTPWSRDPSRKLTAGQPAELYAAHGGYDSDVRVDFGQWVVAPVSGSLSGSSVSVDLLERQYRARALNQGLPVIRDASADPAFLVDILARQVGYHQTPDAVPSAIVCASMAGGATPAVGLFAGALIEGWDRATGALGTDGSTIAIYGWQEATAVLGVDDTAAYLTLNTVGTVLITFGPGALGGVVYGPQVELRPGGVVAVRPDSAASWTTTTYTPGLDVNHPHRVQLELKPGTAGAPGMYVRARSAGDAAWSTAAAAPGGTFGSAFPWARFDLADGSSMSGLQITAAAEPGLWTPNNADLRPLGGSMPAAWLPGDLDPWAGIQQVCAAHLGACWVRSGNELVLQDRDYLAGVGTSGDVLDVGRRVQDLGWTVDPADTADRLVVSYAPVDMVQSPYEVGSLQPVAWEASDAIELKPFASVEVEVVIDFFARVAPAPRWVGAWDTANLHKGSTFSTYDSRDGATSGTLAAYGGITISLRHVSGTRFVIRLTNNLNTTLWTVDANGAPCLILRAFEIAPQATTATVVRGAAEGDAVNALAIDLGKLVQTPEDAEAIADYIWARVSTPMWKASSVRTRLDWDRDIGDVVQLVHERTGLAVKALVTKVALDGQPGEVTQSLDLVLLPVTWADFDAAWADGIWDDFDDLWASAPENTWDHFDADPARR